MMVLTQKITELVVVGNGIYTLASVAVWNFENSVAAHRMNPKWDFSTSYVIDSLGCPYRQAGINQL